MSYVQIAQKYEVVQLGTAEGAQDDFITALGGDPDDTVSWTKNEDGSVTWHTVFTATITPTWYAVSSGYWGDFPGWDDGLFGFMPTDLFAAQFVSE